MITPKTARAWKFPDQNARTYAAVASALMRTAMFMSRPPKTHSERPITPIVIQPSVPECRCVRSASRLSGPNSCVAFARPRSAVSVKIARPYWKADRVSSLVMDPSLRDVTCGG